MTIKGFLLCSVSFDVHTYSETGWIPKQDMPPISKEFKKKASTVLKSALTIIDDYDEKEEEELEKKKSCSGIAFSCLFNGECCPKIPTPGLFKVKPVSPKLKKAQKIGVKLGMKLLFPSIPKLLRDLWVGVELAAATVQFILACLQLNFNDDIKLGVSVFILTVVSFSLGLMDGWTYFYSLGSCHDCHEAIKQRRRGEKGDSVDKGGPDLADTAEEEMDDLPATKWQKVKLKWKKTKEWLDQSFELLRTVLSELLLYPLIMFDLLDLLGSEFDVSTPDNQISFSLFLLGGLFLILTVYIVRFMILSTTIGQLNRMPVTCLKKQDHVMTITRFLIHVMLQVIVHFLCIVAVGVKIKQENFGNTTDSVIVSPYLLYSMVAGWVLPFLGILSFFVVKYYWFEEFSAGMYLDMLAMLQTQGFAEAVFHKQATQLASESASKFMGKIDDTWKRQEQKQLKMSGLGQKKPGFLETEDETKMALDDEIEIAVDEKSEPTLDENITTDSPSTENSSHVQALQDTSKDYMKSIDFNKTKVEFESRQASTSYAYKFLYPLKIPLFALFAIFYDAVFISFCSSLLLTSDSQGGYRVSAFDGGSFSISIIVCVVFIIIGNINILIAINLWIVIAVLSFTILLPFLPFIIYMTYRRRKASKTQHETSEFPSLKSAL